MLYLSQSARIASVIKRRSHKPETSIRVWQGFTGNDPFILEYNTEAKEFMYWWVPIPVKERTHGHWRSAAAVDMTAYFSGISGKNWPPKIVIGKEFEEWENKSLLARK